MSGELLPLQVTVNGVSYDRHVAPRLLLVEFLRDGLGLTGTHVGCEEGICGACTVDVDGATVKSCLLLAVQVDGGSVTTIEGVGSNGELGAIQQAFWESHAVQCGFCTPGMVMSARALLAKDPSPSEETIREHMVGNLCRCTGYQNIVAAVAQAATLARSV
jgi:carbon-monoxide dehydrogenase small subunit